MVFYLQDTYRANTSFELLLPTEKEHLMFFNIDLPWDILDALNHLKFSYKIKYVFHRKNIEEILNAHPNNYYHVQKALQGIRILTEDIYTEVDKRCFDVKSILGGFSIIKNNHEFPRWGLDINSNHNDIDNILSYHIVIPFSNQSMLFYEKPFYPISNPCDNYRDNKNAIIKQITQISSESIVTIPQGRGVIFNQKHTLYAEDTNISVFALNVLIECINPHPVDYPSDICNEHKDQGGIWDLFYSIYDTIFG